MKCDKIVHYSNNVRGYNLIRKVFFWVGILDFYYLCINIRLESFSYLSLRDRNVGDRTHVKTYL